METVDKLNNKKEYLNKVSERHKKVEGEYRQSVHTWIMNSNGEFLIQKRTPNKKHFPNMWSQTGGGVESGETTLQAAIRECNEELGINVEKDEIEFMLSFKRKYDFVDVWLVKHDYDISTLVLQEDEVSDVKWASIDEIRELMKTEKLAKSIEIYFDMFISLLNYPF